LELKPLPKNYPIPILDKLIWSSLLVLVKGEINILVNDRNSSIHKYIYLYSSQKWYLKNGTSKINEESVSTYSYGKTTTEI